jgi:DNA-binding transcriptional ArsR family regulator
MAYEKMLQALADPSRQRIVATLAARTLTVGDIAKRLPVSRPAVSQHLKVLREAGLVVERRQGTRHYFSVDAAAAGELRDYFQSMWETTMRAFARHVAREEASHGSSARKPRR